MLQLCIVIMVLNGTDLGAFRSDDAVQGENREQREMRFAPTGDPMSRSNDLDPDYHPCAKNESPSRLVDYDLGFVSRVTVKACGCARIPGIQTRNIDKLR